MINPFKIALEARKGEIKPDILRGAAKLIYENETITDDMLEGYSTAPKPKRTRPVVQNHSTFKY